MGVPQDRKYLETLAGVFHGGPAGVEAIAHTMNTAVDTLVDDVEPYLLRAGIVVRTRRGRMLTSEGYEHLGLSPPERAPWRCISHLKLRKREGWPLLLMQNTL